MCLAFEGNFAFDFRYLVLVFLCALGSDFHVSVSWTNSSVHARKIFGHAGGISSGCTSDIVLVRKAPESIDGNNY